MRTGCRAADYLAWTSRWVEAAARVLDPLGSLFLNVGGKPTDPWTALDVAQAVRPHLHLQNTLHWVKSIAIDQDAAGGASGLTQALAVGHYKPINSPRFVNDCHEFIFHFTPTGRTPLDRLAVGVPYQDESNIARWRGAGTADCAAEGIRGSSLTRRFRIARRTGRTRPHFRRGCPSTASGCTGLYRITEAVDPFLGLGNTAVACARLELSFVGIEMDRRLSAGGDRPDASGPRRAARVPAVLALPRYLAFGAGGGRSEYARRDHTFTRSRVVLMSSLRLRCVGSGFVE